MDKFLFFSRKMNRKILPPLRGVSNKPRPRRTVADLPPCARASPGLASTTITQAHNHPHSPFLRRRLKPQSDLLDRSPSSLPAYKSAGSPSPITTQISIPSTRTIPPFRSCRSSGSKSERSGLSAAEGDRWRASGSPTPPSTSPSPAGTSPREIDGELQGRRRL